MVQHNVFICDLSVLPGFVRGGRQISDKKYLGSQISDNVSNLQISDRKKGHMQISDRKKGHMQFSDTHRKGRQLQCCQVL